MGAGWTNPVTTVTATPPAQGNLGEIVGQIDDEPQFSTTAEGV
jgi:hypothetical protein